MRHSIHDHIDGRDNNFNLIRMLAALCVLGSHAFPITLGPGTGEPLYESLGLTLGTVSVYIFFVMSGFMITQSFERSSSAYSWIAARVLRILPGLCVVVLLTALILGPIVTALPLGTYFSDTDVGTYVVRNITLFSLQFELPGVFLDNPFGQSINGSLWTLIHEVGCYAVVFSLGILGLLARKSTIVALVAVVAIVQLAFATTSIEDQIPNKIVLFANLLYPYAMGMLLFKFSRSIPLSWTHGLFAVLIALVFHGTFLFPTIFIWTLSYWVFLLGLRPGGLIRLYNKLGDYSYGLYIYAFPVQQSVIFYFDVDHPMQNILIAVPITFVCAAMSWRFIESPALRAKPRVSAWLIDKASMVRL